LELDLHALTAGGDSGVAHGVVLTRFAEAALSGAACELDEARAAVRAELGDAGLIDTAAIIATFQKMDRVADSIGIPLDAATEMASRGFRAALGVDGFATAANTPTPGFLQRVGAAFAGPLASTGLRMLSRVQRRIAARLIRRL
jgi:hypothetical protein